MSSPSPADAAPMTADEMQTALKLAAETYDWDRPVERLLARATISAAASADAEMLRVKACEHIALGDDGWEKLRNECPSTAAVAGLRDALLASETARAAAEERVKEMEREAEHHVAMRKRCSDDNVALSRLRNAAEAQAARLREALEDIAKRPLRHKGCTDLETLIAIREMARAALTPPSQEGDGRE